MNAEHASQILVLSAGLAITFSCLLGFAMLGILQRLHDKPRSVKVNLRQIGAAHLDWIMLALMLGLITLYIQVFKLSQVPHWVVWAFVFGAWVNPLSYLFRAFGVNAFVFAGPPLQRLSAALGGISTALVVSAWFGLFWQTWITR